MVVERALGKSAPRDLGERLSTAMAEPIWLIDGLTILLDHAGVDDPKTQAKSTVAELVGALSLARSAEKPTVAKEMLAASRQAVKQRLGLASQG